MDQESGKQLIGYIKKYPYILLVALVGVFLMLVPQKQEEPRMQAVSYSEMPAAPDLETLSSSSRLIPQTVKNPPTMQET